MASAFVCLTCGVQYPPSEVPPSRCPICCDERQYVGWEGQKWTTLEALRSTHLNILTEEEPGVTSLWTQPGFAIGQRAFLIEHPAGNVLWDCISLVDPATLAALRQRGGISAIAISHPHYYSAMIDWSRAFGDVPVYLHERDRAWAVRRDGNLRWWSGSSLEIAAGLALVHCGGHFEGFQVLVWRAGAGGRGVLFAGDQPQVAMDRQSVSFLYSYPNMIPLGRRAVEAILAALEPWSYDRLYGAFPGRTLLTGAKDVVRRSADRYLRFISD